MSFATELPARIDDRESASYARLRSLLRWLPTAGTVAVLAVAALLAAGVPAGRGVPGSAAPQPVPGAPAFQPPIVLVLVDSADDNAAFLDLDPSRVGVSPMPPPIVVIIDVRDGGGFTSEAAREFANLQLPFELIDLRGP
jgi:hypothetical protein